MDDAPPPDLNNFPVIMPVYNRADIYFEHGEGVYLFDDKGNKYLDFIGGIAVVGLGHANPQITKALHEQAQKLWITSNIFHTHVSENLAKRLVDLTFADTVFFQNSGVESWECGIKVIRKYFSTIGQPQRYRVISFQGNFHGRTLAAIAASKTEKMTKGFGPMTDGFDVVAWDNMNEVRGKITEETAAIVIEPVIGEGGMKPASPEFLKALRATCDEFGLLLYFDEIQCGMGRTGKLFAHEWSGVTPDVMCIAKALGNGFPIGACLATAKAAQGMTIGTHGSTYGGNPLGAAVGTAVLDVMTKPGFLDDVKRKGDYMWNKMEEILKKHPKVFADHLDVLMPPLSALEMTVGFTLGGILRGLAVGAASIIVLVPFTHLPVEHPEYIAYHALMGSTMLSLMGLIGGLWADKFDHMAVVQNFIVMPATFLSGTFYSADRLPGAWKLLCHLNPFFYMIDGFRYGFIGVSDGTLGTGLIVMAMIDVVLLLITYRMFASGYKIKS